MAHDINWDKFENYITLGIYAKYPLELDNKNIIQIFKVFIIVIIL